MQVLSSEDSSCSINGFAKKLPRDTKGGLTRRPWLRRGDTALLRTTTWYNQYLERVAPYVRASGRESRRDREPDDPGKAVRA